MSYGPHHKPKSTGKTVAIVLLSIGCIFSLAWGCAGFSAASGKSATAVVAKATVTTTETATEYADTSTPTEASSIRKPTKKDIKLGVKELERSCFGTFGCNVTYRIKPQIVTADPFVREGVTFEITYRVVGGESPKTGTFTILDGTANYDTSDYVSGVPSGTKLKAIVTSVEALD